METILFLAHTETDGSLGKAALESLSAAKALAASLAGSQLVVGLVGAEVQAAANQISSCGASRFLGVAGADFGQARYSSDVVAAEMIGKTAAATIIVGPATSRWNRVLAGAAQRLGGRIDTHATGLAAADGKISITRWYYRQRMEGVLTRTQRPWIILLESGCSLAGIASRPAHDRDGRAGTRRRRSNHPARCQVALCRGCWLDQETSRRAGAS
jgi:electron transfer flavoprotein alpha subunit